MSTWPFEDTENVATITVQQIVHGGQPILLVIHDDEDGAWQFLTGGEFKMENAMVVALKEIVVRDPSIKQLADLPTGWRAWRERKEQSWQRARI